MAKKETQSLTLTYRDAGVDIDAGDALVDAIKPAARRTNRAGANPELGGFGGLFDLKAAGYRDPILVAATDGVGTKLELAQSVSQHRDLGIDLVAMPCFSLHQLEDLVFFIMLEDAHLLEVKLLDMFEVFWTLREQDFHTRL